MINLFLLTFQSLSANSLIRASDICEDMSTLGTMSRTLTSNTGFSSSLATSKDSVDPSVIFPRVGFGGTSP